jgi:hypothetical protein
MIGSAWAATSSVSLAAVLHDADHGFWCRGCRLVYLPNVKRY